MTFSTMLVSLIQFQPEYEFDASRNIVKISRMSIYKYESIGYISIRTLGYF